MRVTVLAGGTGAAKFLRGLVKVIPATDLTVVVNTGDDLEWWGLHVSPDIDTICYELAGMLDAERGWGRREETFQCRDAMGTLGEPDWFSVGDRDLATHLFRTAQLQAGQTLPSITSELCRRWGIASHVLPATGDRLRTMVTMDDGEIGFQEFFVRRRHQGAVHAVRFDGAESASPAPGVLEGIAEADVVIIAPSNPITSVGPILAVPGVANALEKTSARVTAISPIIGTAAFSGPADRLMKMRGLPASAAGVAQAYRPFLDVLIADDADAGQRAEIEAAGASAFFTSIRMRTTADAECLAREAIHV
jgi:LPPG:FO 2-phospho-L-lactate transferase